MKRVFETAECEAVRNSIFCELRYEKHENQGGNSRQDHINFLIIITTKCCSRQCGQGLTDYSYMVSSPLARYSNALLSVKPLIIVGT